MRVGIIATYMDYHRRGAHHRGVLQPQIGPLIAALLPRDVDVDVINDTWEDPDWWKDYDLLFISSLHPDFDRARQISHYWRRRGSKTVYGGILASTYPNLCRPFFDALVVGDPEGAVPRLYDDFKRNELKPIYVSLPYDPTRVPPPRLELLARKQPVPISIEITRGCPFCCEFCALTGIGTRYHTRSAKSVVRDIREAQRVLRGYVPSYKLYMAVFNDNNIGGNPGFLRELCAALASFKKKVFWGSALTFNVVMDLQTVKALSRAGCRFVFMGLESFNRDAIADMRKFQNTIEVTKSVINQCRRYGILVESGLMINPMVDDCKYMRTIPESLEECGLHIPTFICFESPIPGTPHFHRLASLDVPTLLPNALLRDFTGYTLVTRPKREDLSEFVQTYKWLLQTVYSNWAKILKLADDLPRFLLHGYAWTALLDLIVQAPTRFRVDPSRTYLAGTDKAPPEASNIPFGEADFRSEEERRLILEPWRVTDSAGRVLPQWRHSVKVFEARGQVSASAKQLVASENSGL